MTPTEKVIRNIITTIRHSEQPFCEKLLLYFEALKLLREIDEAERKVDTFSEYYQTLFSEYYQTLF